MKLSDPNFQEEYNSLKLSKNEFDDFVKILVKYNEYISNKFWKFVKIGDGIDLLLIEDSHNNDSQIIHIIDDINKKIQNGNKKYFHFDYLKGYSWELPKKIIFILEKMKNEEFINNLDDGEKICINNIENFLSEYKNITWIKTKDIESKTSEEINKVIK